MAPIPKDLHSLVDSAICLWDVINEPDADPRWEEWRDNYGSMGVRQWCIDNAHIVEDLWVYVRDELDYHDCFDFELVPMLMSTCIDWVGATAPVIRADSRDILRGVILLTHR